MKRTLSVLLCLAMLLITAASVTAAPVDSAAAGDGSEVYLDIYLFANSEYPIASGEYEYGDVPTRPEDPGREGETFIDWYTSPSFSFRFDFSKPLYEDAAIYARFVPEDQAIGVNVFASPDSDYPMYGYLCAKGDLMEYPKDPEYGEDEEILGWYSDRALTNQVDFSQPIYTYTYLFPYIVAEEDLCYGAFYYDVSDTEPISYIPVEKGKTCPAPEDLGKPDMLFEGWYSDRALKHPFDFTKPVYEDFELFPKFTAIHYHDLQFVDVIPATATADGVKAHYVCTTCGKWFEPTATALIEIEDHEAWIIPAKGPYLLGDANGSGDVESTDVTAIQRKISNLKFNSGFCRGAADVDGDGAVTIIDATYIQRYQARMNTPYPIGEPVMPSLG